MADHRATITWQGSATPADFVKGRFSREHLWTFDGGVTVPGSSSPAVVLAPWSNPAHVDPEEAFVAAVASCHMLTFLYLAAKSGFAVATYRDEAVGVLTKNERGARWISAIKLSPEITYAGDRQPTAAELSALHHGAHDECFIANSVKTEILVTS